MYYHFPFLIKFPNSNKILVHLPKPKSGLQGSADLFALKVSLGNKKISISGCNPINDEGVELQSWTSRGLKGKNVLFAFKFFLENHNLKHTFIKCQWLYNHIPFMIKILNSKQDFPAAFKDKKPKFEIWVY